MKEALAFPVSDSNFVCSCSRPTTCACKHDCSDPHFGIYPSSRRHLDSCGKAEGRLEDVAHSSCIDCNKFVSLSSIEMCCSEATRSDQATVHRHCVTFSLVAPSAPNATNASSFILALMIGGQELTLNARRCRKESRNRTVFSVLSGRRDVAYAIVPES